MGKFYAVRKGRKAGIYSTWPECEKQVKGFTGAKFKKFDTREEAEDFIGEEGKGKGDSKGSASTSARDRSRSPVDRKPATVNVYTDGSCFNIKTEQVGGAGVYWGEDDDKNLSEKIKIDGNLTKNGAEIMAARRAIEIADDEGVDNITIHTDNNYLFNCATKWINGWKKKDFKNSSGDDVGNKKEVVALSAAMDGDVEVSWVMQKGTDEMKAADKLSNDGARSKDGAQHAGTSVSARQMSPEGPQFSATPPGYASQLGRSINYTPVPSALNNSARCRTTSPLKRKHLSASPVKAEYPNPVKRERIETEYQGASYLNSEHSASAVKSEYSASTVKSEYSASAVKEEYFYAVTRGRVPGIYNKWEDFEDQVYDYPQPLFKRCNSREEAEDHVTATSVSTAAPVQIPAASPTRRTPRPVTMATASSPGGSTLSPNIPGTSGAERFSPYPASNPARTRVSASGFFYAVQVGHRPGIYDTWPECQRQVKDFPSPLFRKFKNLKEAEDFVGVSANAGLTNSSNTAAASTLATATPRATASSAEVYTDGCCHDNGKGGAKGGIGVYWGEGDKRNVARQLDGRQTNNRAEIMAATVACQQAREQGIRNLTIHTDSQFMISAITGWIYKWKRNGWKLANGRPVINKDDFVALERAMDGVNVKWNKVKAHVGIHGNERADQLANQGAKQKKSKHICD